MHFWTVQVNYREWLHVFMQLLTQLLHTPWNKEYASILTCSRPWRLKIAMNLLFLIKKRFLLTKLCWRTKKSHSNPFDQVKCNFSISYLSCCLMYKKSVFTINIHMNQQQTQMTSGTGRKGAKGKLQIFKSITMSLCLRR